MACWLHSFGGWVTRELACATLIDLGADTGCRPRVDPRQRRCPGELVDLMKRRPSAAAKLAPTSTALGPAAALRPDGSAAASDPEHHASREQEAQHNGVCERLATIDLHPPDEVDHGQHTS